jgi:hypothetical protein
MKIYLEAYFLINHAIFFSEAEWHRWPQGAPKGA